MATSKKATTSTRKKAPAKKASAKRPPAKKAPVKNQKPKLPKYGPGRKRAFRSVDEFEWACREFIAHAEGRTVERVVHKRSGDEVVQVKSPAPLMAVSLCQYLGISRSTFYRYLESDHEYHLVAEWFQDCCELDMTERLFMPKQHNAAKFILQAKFDYSEKKDIQVSGGISDEEFLAALDREDEE
jgi:hypothetical protein